MQNPVLFCYLCLKVFLEYENQRFDLDGVRAVIFDLDGTLVESEPIWAEAKRFVANASGIDVPEYVLSAFVGRSVADFVAEVIAPPDESVVEQDIINRALARYEGNLAEMPGAAALVIQFSDLGYLTAICSSAPEHAIEKCIAFLGIGSRIDAVVSAEQLARGKPDKLPYVETLRRLGLPPENALAVEDAAAGLTSATAAGIKTICVGNEPDTQKFGCQIYAKEIGMLKLSI